MIKLYNLYNLLFSTMKNREGWRSKGVIRLPPVFWRWTWNAECSLHLSLALRQLQTTVSTVYRARSETKKIKQRKKHKISDFSCPSVKLRNTVVWRGKWKVMYQDVVKWDRVFCLELWTMRSAWGRLLVRRVPVSFPGRTAAEHQSLSLRWWTFDDEVSLNDCELLVHTYMESINQMRFC